LALLRSTDPVKMAFKYSVINPLGISISHGLDKPLLRSTGARISTLVADKPYRIFGRLEQLNDTGERIEAPRE